MMSRRRQPYISVEVELEIVRLYTRELWTARRLQTKFGCGYMRIKSILAAHGAYRRSAEEARAIAWHGSVKHVMSGLGVMTEEQMDARIKEMTAEIQAEWTPAERAKRAHEVTEPMTVTRVRGPTFSNGRFAGSI